ncbi:MAG TPA: PEP-CTERM sorting domain-containing protein [Tepidisphaeraceae bacterium]|nr:PEP-CTERM sorting domain-containing protein [Tepidisphaeraceae bacterium]
MQRVLAVLARTGHGDGVSFSSRWLRWTKRAFIGVAGCLALGPVSAWAQITFTRVADNSTVAPDGTLFSGQFGISPAIDGTNVVFSAGSERYLPAMVKVNNDMGVYRWDGHGLTTVADANTPVPGAPGESMAGMSFNSVAISGTEVAFSARSTSDPLRSGVFATFNGALKTLATTNTPVPGGSGTFTSFGRVARSGDNVAFANAQIRNRSGAWGRDLQYQASGIYMSQGGGAVTKVVDETTKMPGKTSTFTGLYDSIDINGVNVAFVAWMDVYVADDSGIARRNTSSFLYPQVGVSLDGADVAFGDNYLCAWLDGTVQRLALGNATNGDRYFSLIDRNPSIDNRTIVFGGKVTGAMGTGYDLCDLGGIYMWRDGEISKVIDVNDTLDGKALANLHTGPDSLSGDNIAFHVQFKDGTEGIYVATVPEPGAAMLLAGGVAVLGLGARRRRS